jgi:hypothetical protein
VQEAALDQVELGDLHVVKLKPHSDKALRIQKLSPYVVTGRLRFNRKLTGLYQQLRYWPQADHDDGPDALELCMEVAGTLGMQFVEMGGLQPAPRRLNPYMEQLRQGLPFALDTQNDEAEVCGTCENARPRPDGRCMCDLHRLLVAKDCAACGMYSPA